MQPADSEFYHNVNRFSLNGSLNEICCQHRNLNACMHACMHAKAGGQPATLDYHRYLCENHLALFLSVAGPKRL
jgi:hypothetical protein